MTESTRQRAASLLAQLTLKEKITLLSGLNAWMTHPIPRLGIPSITMTDGPHGVRASNPEAGRKFGPTTCFPTGVAFAATWNTELIEQVGEALAEETRAMGCDILLGPCVNIVRHPLAGRNFESYSEDPFLAGKIGAAWVNGLQRKQVGASLKHFACNNQEFERLRGNSVVDERTLREIYLPQFEMIVRESRPFTVMCAYNRVNGDHASQNAHLLREILKEEWGFDGAVVSDWTANHTTAESMNAGLDLEMPGPAKYYGTLLEDAVAMWQVEEETIDEAALRILNLVLQCGAMDAPSSRPAGSVNTPQHQRLALKVAEEAITLLKNDGGLLPIEPARLRKVVVIGPNAAEDRIGGGGSSFVDPPYTVSPLQALRELLPGVEIVYEKGCDNYENPPIVNPAWITPLDRQGTGITISFYDNPSLEGEPVNTHNAIKPDFWWFTDSLTGEHLTGRAFSARISCILTVPESGRYRIVVGHSAPIRLLVDKQVILEDGLSVKQSSDNYADFFTPVDIELDSERSYRLDLEFLKADEMEFGACRINMARFFAQEDDQRLQRAADLAASADAAFIFAGMPEGFESEGSDRPHMRLTGQQDELIRAVAAANPRTVVILNTGSPVEMPWANAVPAILEAYYPGQEGGRATAEILLGMVNPSGKLTVTFPARLQDTPAYIHFPGERDVHYGEGLFVGYRYFDRKELEPLFPFGYGLSYTGFAYGPLNAPSGVQAGDPVELTLTVTNTGPRAGKEVVQLYVADETCSLPRPPKELKAFAKVDLQPGETREVRFVLDRRAFAFYHDRKGDWVVEPGKFHLLAGSSSRDIRASAVIEIR